MIAQRFRALGWVAGIASAATGLYLISLQVAAERAKLDGVEQRIAAARRDMRQLQTELGTRASQRQLEKWNNEDLALAAPRAAQYLHDVSQLASLSLNQRPSAASNAAPPAVLAAAPASLRAPAPVVAVAEAPLPAAPRLQRAAFVPDSAPTPRVQRVAMIDRIVLDRSTMGDLIRTAAEERRKRP